MHPINNIKNGILELKNQTPTFSIVISVYNKEHIIYQTIDLIKRTCLKNHNIVVINDCSSDNSLDILKNITNIHLIHNNQNLGWSTSNNIALNNINTEYCVFLDADCLIGTIGWVEMWYHTINKQNLGESGELHYCPTVYNYADIYNFLIHQPWINNNSNQSNNIKKRETSIDTIGHIGGSYKFFKTQTLKEIGGFAPTKIPVQTETEISFRIKAFGYNLIPYRIPIRHICLSNDNSNTINIDYQRMIHYINIQEQFLNEGVLLTNPLNIFPEKGIYNN